MAAISTIHYKSMLDASDYYGAGAIAGKKGIIVRPAPGRSGLLAKLQQTFSPAEVKARFFEILFGTKNNSDRLISSMMQNADVKNVALVVRSYGQSITHFFRNLGPGGGVTPARSVTPKASSAALNKAAGINVSDQREKLLRRAAEKEYRNVIDSALSDHKEWSTLAGFYQGQTSMIPAKLPQLKEITSNKNNEFQTWEFKKRQISLERGLFVTVAAGFHSDGSEVISGQKSGRSTFLGKRVDIIPLSNGKEYIERLRREWGQVMLLESGIKFSENRAEMEKAIKVRECPIDISPNGVPLARLVYDRNMFPGSSILLASSKHGFVDVGRGKDGKNSQMHPDVLDVKFKETWNEYQKKMSPIPAAKTPNLRSRISSTVDSNLNTFALSFKEICKDIRPSDTAIVFKGGTSRYFSLVHRTTGDEISDIPVMALSNLPDGKYARLRSDEFEAWKKPSKEKRNNLSSIVSGHVTVESGTLSHFNAEGKPHNDYNGPSVVRAAVGSDGMETTPSGVAWHDNDGNKIGEQQFLTMRYQEAIIKQQANAPKPEPFEEGSFGSVPDETPVFGNRKHN